MANAKSAKRRLPRANFAWLEGREEHLYPFQLEGAKKLARNFGLRAFLDDDPGLGKTVQAICAVFSRPRKALPALVVCAKREKKAWATEIERWTGVSCAVITGRPKAGVRFKASDAKFTVINYDVLSAWDSILYGFRTIIFDDCERLANLSDCTYAARKLAAGVGNILAITDLNVYRRPSNFFNTFNILRPDMFPSFFSFTKEFCCKIKNKYLPWGYELGSCRNRAGLQDILCDFTLSRRSEEVKDQLPKAS